ncbi:uncharacterized protein [Cherax quadricarinatus]|uniref:uncharacterized protein isoform X1 n=1 Tax=Cherax quadricarinatus TaxID=27406 RepID=UPI00387E2130
MGKIRSTEDEAERTRPRRVLLGARTYASVLEEFRKTSSGREGEDPPAEEVANMISSLLTRHLAGCYKMVLYTPEEPYLGVVDAVVSSLGDATLLWEMDSFLLTSPPYTVLTTTHHHAHAYCVAFVILARLQDVGRVTTAIQRGKWFQNASKMMLVYTGSVLPLATLDQHNFFGTYLILVFLTVLLFKKSLIQRAEKMLRWFEHLFIIICYILFSKRMYKS